MADKVLALDNGRVKQITLLGSGLNFSIKKILSSVEVTIPENQQMIVAEGIEIEGSLVIEGELCLIF